MTKVDLGCGMRKREGFAGIDIRDYPGVDYVLNIGKNRLPFASDSVSEIVSDNTFEHLYPEELFFAMEECFRVLKPSGFMTVAVPKAGTTAYFINPDHKIQFTQDTFGFFQVPAGGKDPNGYLKGFWHIEPITQPNPEAIWVNMHPNKPGGKYPYVEVTR